MDADNRPEPEVCKFLIPLALVKSLSEIMLDVINSWQEEYGSEGFDIHYCQAVMLAATEASVETLSFGKIHGTMQ